MKEKISKINLGYFSTVIVNKLHKSRKNYIEVYVF